MRSIFTFLISSLLIIGASSNTQAQFITPEQPSVDVPYSAGSTSVNVSSDVSWTASADESWITSAVNNGSGQLEITFEENTSTSVRDAIVTLTDGSISAAVTVNQAGATPVLNVTPSSRSAAKGGETVTFSVVSNITWNAVDDAGWLELSNSSNQISATAAANNTVEERTANITVSGSGVSPVTVTVVQAAGDATVSVTPSNRDVTNAAGSTTFDVTSNTTWNASDDAGWLTLSNASNQITASYTENTSTEPRTATITVTAGSASQNVTVSQAGAAAYITPTSTTVNVGSGDSQTSVTINSNVSWTIDENILWLTANKNGTSLDIDYDANPGISSRSGNITLNSTEGATATVTVTQAGAAAYITPSSTTVNVGSDNNQTSVAVSSNVSWTIDENISWLTANKNGTSLDIDYDANPNTTSRSGNITLNSTEGATATVTVNQAGAAANLSINPTTASAAKGGQTLTFDVTSNISWSASDDADWVSLSSSSSQISAIVSANNTVSSRTATITVTGSGVSPVTATITQAAGDPTLTITPDNRNVSNGEGTVTFAVSSNTSWSVSDDANWLGAMQASPTQINAMYSENTAVSARTATITVTAGSLIKTVTVKQSGAAPSLTVPSTVLNVPSSSGTSPFAVNANFTTWTATESSSWFTILKGVDQVNVTYQNNTSADSRTDTVTVSGEGITRKVAVVQEGAPAAINAEPETKSVTYAAGSTSFSVTANFSDWTVEKIGDWITSATKSGSSINVNYQVNGTITARSGKIIAKGRGTVDTVTITQDAGPASITINPLSRNVAYQQGSTTFLVTSNVTWTPTESVPWITSAGRNGDTLIVVYERNNAITSRQASITVTGGGVTKEVFVIQAEAPAYITPNVTLVEVGNASGSASVNVESNVTWNVSENSNWFSAEKIGTQVEITYNANLTVEQRTGTINLTSTEGANAAITVVQAAGLPFITPATEAVSVTEYIAGSSLVSVTANIPWTAAESSDWFSIAYTSSGITINYTENMTVSSRSGNITVSGSGVNETITVTQIAGPERLTVIPGEQTLGYMEGDASFAVESNVSWSVNESLSWLITNKEPGKFLIGVIENTSADSRTGSITVKGSSITKAISITQSGAPPAIDAEPENNEVGYGAGTGSFTVASNFTNWSVIDDAGWLTVTKSGTFVNISYQENGTVSSRIGKVIVSGRGVSDTVLVTQQAGLSDLNVTPVNRSVAYTAGETSFDVTANVEWTVAENVAWLSAVKSGSQIIAAFEENTSTSSRTGNITLSGGSITHTLTVTQDGRPEVITLTPASIEVSYTAGFTFFNVAANTETWSVSENISWLTVAISGSKTNITYESNSSINVRTGKITITAGDSSKTFTITQQGTPTAISSNPASASVSFLEGAANFNITSNVDWIVSDNADWLTSTKNGTLVQVNYSKNTLREQRQGIITVSGGGHSLDIILTQGGNLEVGKPLLLAPANNIYKSGLNLLFEWHKPALAEEYALEISDSVQFTNIIYSYKDITDSSYSIASLKEGVKYFWRIKASNSYGYYTYSDVWNFTAKLLQPGNLRISQNAFDEVILSWIDNSKNETGYDILRKSGEGQFVKLISVPSGQVNYIDAEIPASGQYTYRIYAFNAASVSDTSEVSINVTIIGIDDDPALDIPTEYSLSEAYPNPFNPSAKIRYGLPEESAVVIEIFNILGERVETLLNEQVSAGYHEARWNAYSMPSGIYIIRTYAKSLSSDRKFVSVKKAMLLK